MHPLPAHLVGLGAGLLVGCAGSFLQAVVLDLGPVSLPAGLLLSLALTALAAVRAGRLAASRSGALAALIGWVVAVVAVTLPNAAGDVVLPNSTLAVVWLYGGALVAGACTVPAYGRGVRAPGGEGAGAGSVVR